MKELQDFKESESAKAEIVQQKQQEKQTVLVNSIRPHSGHKCFEYNRETGEIKLAEFEEIAVSFEAAARGEIAPKKKILMKENCVYITALNKKNALRKLNN